jgi:hypothetical protein
MIIDELMSIWPIVLAAITLVVVLAKMNLSIEILSDKVKTLFDLHNKGGK